MTVEPENLLVVEDNLDIWLILKTLIPHALPDVKIIHALDAPAALDYLQRCSKHEQAYPQLILQNLYLPNREDGLALVRRLKQADSPYRQIPIIVMSSSTGQQDISEAYLAGASTYLVKPINIDDWVKRLSGLQRYLPKNS